MTRVAQAQGAIERLVVEYAAARRALDDMRQQTKPYQERKDRAEQALFDALEDQQLRSVRHAELGLFTLSILADPRIDNSDAFVAWAEKAMPELLMANRQRLGVIVREVLKGERDPITATDEGLPPGVGYGMRRSISWRQS